MSEEADMEAQASKSDLPVLVIGGAWHWEHVLDGSHRAAFEAALARAVPERRWFASKLRTIERLTVVDAVAVTPDARWLLVEIRFDTGPDEVYQVPLVFAAAEGGRPLTAAADARPWIRVVSASGDERGSLYDALADGAFCRRLVELFESPAELPGTKGTLLVEPTAAFDALRGQRQQPLEARLLRGEQSNSSLVFGDALIAKIFRRVETGLNPDFEVSAFLSRQGFRHTPALAGSLVFQARHEDPWALALLQAFVPNRGDAWRFTLDWLAAALDALSKAGTGAVVPLPENGWLAAAAEPIPLAVRSPLGEFLESVELLARRTGEMHLALAGDASDPDFAPEPFSDEDRDAFFGRASDQATETFAQLQVQVPLLAGEAADRARRVIAASGAALTRYAQLAAARVPVDKIRIHGDYHLGQVLATDGDFMIIDFEGEPVRSIYERRQKQLALRDVAGMVRSLHYASRAAAAAAIQRGDDRELVDRWTAAWYAWSAAAFLGAYRRTVGKASFLPDASDDFGRLLGGCLLEKAIYELRYELNNRPDWVYLPLAALVDLLGAA